MICHKRLRKFLRKCYNHTLELTNRFWGPENAKILDTLVRFKRKLNLRSPRDLAEKIAWLEYNDPHPLKVQCTDKWAVRDYVRSKGLEHILVPVYGDVHVSVDTLDLSLLPDAFVIKATHGCGMNEICTDKSKIDMDLLQSKLNTWLTTTYGIHSFEPHYKEIPHRFYIEQYLGDGDAMIDYKFFCYHGVPSFVEICSNRKSSLKLALYDMDWNRIHGITSKRDTPNTFVRPEVFETMKTIAMRLSEDFAFVRVDLYAIQKHIYFSELTFTPAACVLPNFKKSFLLSEGEKLILGMAH